MKLMPANDFEMVKTRYVTICENTPGIERYARWVYGKHPTDDSLRSYIDNGEMYLLADEDDIVGMVVIIMHQGQDYERVPWTENLADDQIATIHLLAVCPAYQGKGFGRKILEEAVSFAKRKGKKSIRLDILKSNLPAQRLYESAGCLFRGKQHLYAENTAWLDFLFYEKKLD